MEHVNPLEILESSIPSFLPSLLLFLYFNPLCAASRCRHASLILRLQGYPLEEKVKQRSNERANGTQTGLIATDD